MASPPLVLDDNLMKSFKTSSVFFDNSISDKPVNSISFYENGEHLVYSTEEKKINLVNVAEAKLTKTVFNKSQGVRHLRFTHHEKCVIYASTEAEKFNVLYHSLKDNKLIREFNGHQAEIVSLDMSPQNDTFITAALDHTVRLWDLRKPSCAALCQLPPQQGYPCAAFDPEGLIFAIATDGNCMKLYDAREFDKGPFDTFMYASPEGQQYRNIRFSADGTHILITTRAGHVMLADAFKAEIVRSPPLPPLSSQYVPMPPLPRFCILPYRCL